ncbi:MAG: hypothetical protein B7X70_13925 [Acidovorax sp. 39-64-12]|nr:MAG: hypothetical protein B7Y64_13155 [Acidovorax sp. 35-64-16]OZA68625.1 MAG: hypothetical protein B7X70_13925 [Acidovorax sp. 39-64-12]
MSRNSMNTRSTVSSQLFFTTPQQRLALARQQFFDDGVRPTGLISEAVIQSWMRCIGARRNPRERVEFEPVTRSRVHSTLGRNRQFLEAAEAGLAELKLALAGTGCRALLIDATGVVVHTSQPAGGACEKILPTLDRVGVNVAEGLIGTSAPGIVTKTGRSCTVLGGEHFFETIQPLYCAAAPIRDASGGLAGVLDLSIESRTFGFDAESLVVQYATGIENRLLLAGAKDQLVVHFHTNATLLGTPFEALAGITEEGRVAWLNEVATRCFRSAVGDVESLFGVTLSHLTTLLRCTESTLTCLPSGIAVWVRASLHARDGTLVPVARAAPTVQPAPPESPSPAPVPAANPRLDVLNREYIDRTLAACGGNVSSAARTLGVSRGLIHRHLRGKR